MKLFDFCGFVADLRKDQSGVDLVNQYEELVEPLNGITDVRDTIFYREYVSRFELPEKLANALRLPISFDYDEEIDLLLRLIFAEGDSYELCIYPYWFEDPKQPMELDLYFSASIGETELVSQHVGFLWITHIKQLFIHYVTNQMDRAALKASWEDRGWYDKLYEQERNVALFEEHVKCLSRQAERISMLCARYLTD